MAQLVLLLSSCKFKNNIKEKVNYIIGRFELHIRLAKIKNILIDIMRIKWIILTLIKYLLILFKKITVISFCYPPTHYSGL